MKRKYCSTCGRRFNPNKELQTECGRGDRLGSGCLFRKETGNMDSWIPTSDYLEHKRKYGREYQKMMRTKGISDYQKIRRKILELFNNECKKCGFSDIRALQIDHINGGGGKERREVGTTQVYRVILKNIEKYQLLCANCNNIKRIENKEHTKYQ